MSQYAERCLVILSYPVLKFTRDMKHIELFNKLPPFYQKAIDRLKVRDVSGLIREIKVIEGDYLH